MNITIFGASGRTGRRLVERMLAAGHFITVLVRNSSRLGMQNERLKIVEGNIQDPKNLDKVITGADAVISVLGPTSNKPTYEVSDGMENIIVCMKNNGVKRLIASAGAGVGDINDAPKLFDHLMNFLLRQTAKYVLEDMVRTAEKVRASELDWTLVRVPMLVDGKPTGKVRVGYVGKGTGPRVTRADMADFILKQIEQKTYIHKAPVISN